MGKVYNFTTAIFHEDGYYVAHNIEFGVVSQGKTIEEAQSNLQEALELYLEDVPREDMLALEKSRPLVTTLQLEHA